VTGYALHAARHTVPYPRALPLVLTRALRSTTGRVISATPLPIQPSHLTHQVDGAHGNRFADPRFHDTRNCAVRALTALRISL